MIIKCLLSHKNHFLGVAMCVSCLGCLLNYIMKINWRTTWFKIGTMVILVVWISTFLPLIVILSFSGWVRKTFTLDCLLFWIILLNLLFLLRGIIIILNFKSCSIITTKLPKELLQKRNDKFLIWNIVPRKLL